jgi:hypothetical protein
MFLTEMFEDAGKRLVVIYPGRFQPFHKGHADVFASLQAHYGSENVFIVTSNKTDGAKSPFNFSDKVRFMHAAGIPDHSIIETNGKVYDLPDVFKPQADNIIFIAAVGAPDAQRLNPGALKKDGTPGYFLKLPGSMDQAVSADQHGYVVIAEERAENVTIGGKSYDASHGTQCRELWNQVRDNPKQRAEFLQQLYGKNDAGLGHILDKIPTGALEPTPKPSPKLKKVKDPAAPSKSKLTPVKEPKPVDEGVVLTKDELMDIYLSGRGKLPGSPDIRRKVATGIPLNKVDAYIDAVSKKFRLNPKAFVYGPPQEMNEAAFGVGYLQDPRAIEKIHKWRDTKTNTQSRMFQGYTLKFTDDAMLIYKGGELLYKKEGDYSNPTNKDIVVGKSRITRLVNKAHAHDLEEEAAGVGVVKGGSDPRYMMATMGDQNDVTPGTLNKMMRGYSLIGKKSMSNQKPVKSSIGQGIKESEVQRKFQMVREELNYIRNYTGQRDQDYYDRARKIQEQIVELEEGWKSKLGAAALAGAAALGGAGPAHADGWDDVMRPINQVRKLDREIHNRVGDVSREVWSQRSRMGRDIENIPIPGISKIGKEIRGSTNQEELHVDPAWQERVRQAEEQRRERQERQQNRQWGKNAQQMSPDGNN